MPHTLLLADDSVTIQRVIELTFADEDVRVVAVSNGEDAIAFVDRTPPDIVLADVGMPGRSGYNLLSQCREDRAYDGVAFVICSSESENRYIIEALKAGATSYLVKPVNEAMFKEHLQKVLSWIERRNASVQRTA